MEPYEEISIVREILRGVPGSADSPNRMRFLRARLRWLGDEIGEPILVDEKEIPAHYIRVDIPVAPSSVHAKGRVLTVAMTDRAAEAILARF